MRSLKEQIAGKCIHFTGTSKEKCKKGIAYDSVKDKSVRPYKLPCLAHEYINGGECKYCEFPSKEEAEKQVKEIEQSTIDMLDGFKAVKDHYEKTGIQWGKTGCSKCDGGLHYRVHGNGHIWANCDDCGIGWIE